MSKEVRLVVGEGDDKIEVGTATVEKIPTGDAMVMLRITNEALIKILGGSAIKGVMRVAEFVTTSEPEAPSGDG